MLNDRLTGEEYGISSGTVLDMFDPQAVDAAAGELFINGVRIGDINCAPFELDCTE